MYSRSVKIFPAECRERAATYKAKMSVTITWKVDGKTAGSMDKVVGQVPIMVKVREPWLLHCYLYIRCIWLVVWLLYPPTGLSLACHNIVLVLHKIRPQCTINASLFLFAVISLQASQPDSRGAGQTPRRGRGRISNSNICVYEL